jgi:hypothetical protein
MSSASLAAKQHQRTRQEADFQRSNNPTLHRVDSRNGDAPRGNLETQRAPASGRAVGDSRAGVISNEPQLSDVPRPVTGELRASGRDHSFDFADERTDSRVYASVYERLSGRHDARLEADEREHRRTSDDGDFHCASSVGSLRSSPEMFYRQSAKTGCDNSFDDGVARVQPVDYSSVSDESNQTQRTSGFGAMTTTRMLNPQDSIRHKRIISATSCFATSSS